MDARTEKFAAELYASFKIEAVEHLKGISDGLLTLEGENTPEVRKETIETIFRDAHSLKGAARAVNLREVQDVCQSLEDVLSSLRNGHLELKPNDFDILHSTVEFLSTLLANQEKQIKTDPELNEALRKKLEAINTGKSDTIVKEEVVAPVVEATPYGAPVTTPTIRVRLQKLDKLMQEVEELSILKLMSYQRHRSLKDLSRILYSSNNRWGQLQSELRKMRQAFEEGSEGNYIPSKEFLKFLEEQPATVSEIEETVLKLSKYTGQEARLATSMIDALLEDTKTILMLPFSSIFDLFPLIVRDMARSLNKNISIIINGGDVEVDRKILEEMKDPLIHLIRNSIDHGIEAPEKRIAAGKDAQGRIIVTAAQTGGNRVEITLCDDGSGIDVKAVKKSAVAQGILTDIEADKLSEEEALKLIFKSGVSTNTIITEFSGRGVGMGVVLEKVEKLNGTVNVQTRLGVGTTFVISLPLTIATFRGVYIKAGGEDYIFPTQHLIRVLRVTTDNIQRIEGKASVTINDQHYSYIHLSELLGRPAPSNNESKYIYLLLIKVTETYFVVGVDQILIEQEVLIKSLGSQLKKVNFIAGVTILDEGKVVPILDPYDMKNALQNSVSTFQSKSSETKKSSTKQRIMVAEDSSTARMLLKNILETAGYQVKTAVNGAEAFAALKMEKVDLLISDVEMPRMTGFELTERLRGMEEFKNLPIILCTSRGSPEDKEHGIEVGANAYIDKKSFQQGHLLEIVSKLL